MARLVIRDSQQHVLFLDPSDRVRSMLETCTADAAWTMHVFPDTAAACVAMVRGMLPAVVVLSVDAGSESEALAAVRTIRIGRGLHCTRIVALLGDCQCLDIERLLKDHQVDVCCQLSTLTPSLLNAIVMSQLQVFSKVIAQSDGGDAVCIEQFELQRVDLHAGIDSALHLLDAELDEGIAIIREYTDIRKVRCNPSMVNQVFMNVIRSAIEELHGAAGEIRIATAERDEHAVIAIRESIREVLDDELPSTDQLCFRSRDATPDTDPGLSLSCGIVARHGGHVEIDAHSGAYTEVRIHLPINGAFDAGRVTH